MKLWPGLVAEAFEDLCRKRLPFVAAIEGGPYGAASRWWRGEEPEWDVVAESLDGESILVGEAKWNDEPISASAIRAAADRLRERALPEIGARMARRRVVRAIFVPEAGSRGARRGPGGVAVITARDLVREA